MLNRSSERGDTIVEVLFSVAIFSLIAIGAFSLVNQGVTTAQRSLESTLVRQEMDAQAETLRFMHNAYTSAYRDNVSFAPNDRSPAANWNELLGHVKGESTSIERATQFGTCPDPERYSDSVPEGGFFVNPTTARMARDRNNMQLPDTWARVQTDSTTNTSKGIWIEGVASEGTPGRVGYIDFHIRACWSSPGLDSPMTLGTIVRLYDPR